MKRSGHTLVELLLVVVILMMLAGVMVSMISLPQPKYVDIAVNPENIYVTSDGRYCYLEETNWFFLMRTNNNEFYTGKLEGDFHPANTAWLEVESYDIPPDTRWKQKIEKPLTNPQEFLKVEP